MNRSLLVRILVIALVLAIAGGAGCPPTPPAPPPATTSDLAKEIEQSIARLAKASDVKLPTAIQSDVAVARLVMEAERLRFANDITDEAVRKAVASDIGYANGIAEGIDRKVKDHVKLTRTFVEDAEKTMAQLPPMRGAVMPAAGCSPRSIDEKLMKAARMERAVLEERPNDMTAAAIASLDADGAEHVAGALDVGLDLEHLTPAQRTTLSMALAPPGAKIKGADALDAYLLVHKEVGPGADAIARHLVQSPSWAMNADQLKKFIAGTVARAKSLKDHYRRPFSTFELAHVLTAGDERNLAAKRANWISTGEASAKNTRSVDDDALRDAAQQTASALGACLAAAPPAQAAGLFTTWLAASSFLTQSVPCQGSPAICTADPALGCTATAPPVCGEKCGATVCGPGKFCDGSACQNFGAGKTCTNNTDCTGTPYTVGFDGATLCDLSSTPGQCTGIGWRCELPAHCGPAQECNETTSHCEARSAFACSDSAPCKSGEACVVQAGGATSRCVPGATVGTPCNPAFLSDGRLAPPDCANGVLANAGGAGTLICRAQPKPEICDGRDQDCDFVADNNPTGLGGCGSPGDVCTETSQLVCENGQTRCVPGPAQQEVCNGKDDDCNGQTDEPPGCPPRCGDGRVDPPEQCDDGNSVDGDGCDHGCVKTPPRLILKWDNVDDDAYAWIGGSIDPGQAICTGVGVRNGQCDIGAEMRARLSSPVDTLVVLRIKNSHCGNTSGHFQLEGDGGAVLWSGMQMDSHVPIQCEWTYKKWLHINPYVGLTDASDKEMYCLWPTDQCWWEP
jgi:cysteine-rich repeat protein